VDRATSGPRFRASSAYRVGSQRMQMRCVVRSACADWKFAATAVFAGSAVMDCALAPEIASTIIDTNVIAFIVISKCGQSP
jgi:hypothetical protein